MEVNINLNKQRIARRGKNFFLTLMGIGFLIAGLGQSVEAQQRTITGTVKDRQDQTLTGVTIKVKGSTSGTVTDFNGKFTINVVGASPVLVFSYTGFVSQEQATNGKTDLSVILDGQATNLNDLVVIGYGTQKKQDLTGSVGQVAVADLQKAPVLSLDQALAGRIAGVQVNSSDGQPGSAVNIVVRGANSITQDNSPLYVVDGQPIEGIDLNTFNPQDIESIDVLKDASSTAIYGARGANGVIMITTKKGKVGTPKVSFTTTQSISNNIKTKELMNSYEFLKYQLELSPGAGPSTPTNTYLTTPGKTLEDYRNYPTADWQSPFFKTGSLQNYSVAVRGGTPQTLYSISGSADNLTGTILTTSYDRYQGRIIVDQTLNDKFKVGINANYSYLKQSGNGVATSTSSATTNILYSVWGYGPFSTFSEDEQIDASTVTSNDYKFNPVLNQRNLVRNIMSNNLNVNTYLNYTIVPDLLLKITGGLNNRTGDYENFNNSNTYYGSPLTNAGRNSGVNGSIRTIKDNNWSNENTLTWNKVYNKSHHLNVLGGFTMQGNTSSDYGFGATFLPNESLGISGLDEGTLNPPNTRAATSLWTASSFLGRINYNYKYTYYVTASYRADGSSKFLDHWSYFPSAALAWRFTQVGLLKNNAIISDGKLRLSYGKTGNNRISDFAYQSSSGVLNGSSYSFNNAYTSSIIPLTLGNSKLKWETTSQYDGGMDISFLKNRISLTADVYRKITKNLLLNATLPTSTGYNTAFENVGSVRNQGLELTLNTVNLSNAKFTWSSSLNISFNQSKVLALANNQEALTSSIRWDYGWKDIPSYISKIGQPLGQMYGYIWDGNYQYSDFNISSTGAYVLKDNVPTNGNTRTSIQPGDIKYRDLNGDGVVNSSDYTVIGNSLPVHIGGFTNNFTYKDFDMSIFFQWSYGNKIQNVNRMVFEGNSLVRQYLGQFASYQDRWEPTNQGSTNYRSNGYFGGGYSSRTIEDGSYVRLKTVSIGYNIPQSLLKKAKISAFRVYVSGQNLWTITNYSGLDPEVSAYNSVLTGGFDYSTYPRARTIAFGANVTF